MNQPMPSITSQHLVLTAIGKDKTGLVSELTGLVSECSCNILDSKMARFGSEFTMIMLLSGDSSSLTKLELQLPQLAMQLNLLTMMKRTSAHHSKEQPQYLINVDGPDQAGTIKKLTSFFAENNIDIRSLKSQTKIENDTPWQYAKIVIDLSNDTNLSTLTDGIASICAPLHVQHSFKPITIE